MRRRTGAAAAALLTLATLTVTPGARAQERETDPRTIAERLDWFELEDVWMRADRADRLDNLADVLNTGTFAFVYYALPARTLAADFRQFLQQADRARVDQQIGTPAAATRTGLTTLLGFAMESGAVSQTVDQQVATLRANADGLLRFLSNQEVIPACPLEDQRCSRPSVLKDLDLSAAFSTGDVGTKTISGTNAATGQPVQFASTFGAQKFIGFTARYAIQNSRDLRSPEYRLKWATWLRANRGALGPAGEALLSVASAALDKVQTADAQGNIAGAGAPTMYSLWLAATRARFRNATSKEALELALSAQLDDLVRRMRGLDPDLDARLADLGEAYLRYLALRRDLAATLITDAALTFEYTYATRPLEPKLHTAKVAWAFSPGNDRGTPDRSPGAAGYRASVSNPGTLTLNAAVHYFHDPQPTGVSAGSSHWKSADVAAQFDRPLGPGDGAARLSIGAYYQYQFSPGVIIVPQTATFLAGTSIPLSDAGRQVLSEKGSLFATQALMTLRLGNSGLKVPIGVSWANRTELVAGNEVRGHIGITFDSTPLLLMPGPR